MGAKGEVLAKRFEAKARDAMGGTVFAGAPPMTAEQLITRGLLDHIDEHFGSIRKTVGHENGG